MNLCVTHWKAFSCWKIILPICGFERWNVTWRARHRGSERRALIECWTQFAIIFKFMRNLQVIKLSVLSRKFLLLNLQKKTLRWKFKFEIVEAERAWVCNYLFEWKRLGFCEYEVTIVEVREVCRGKKEAGFVIGLDMPKVSFPAEVLWVNVTKLSHSRSVKLGKFLTKTLHSFRKKS